MRLKTYYFLLNKNMFCVLGDCNKEECHHCFPVKFCKYNHELCKKEGMCYDVDLYKSKIIVTGCAGFIGYHVCIKLLKDGLNILGVDIMNNYYDTKIKQKNIDTLLKYKNFHFIKEDVVKTEIFKKIKPNIVIHLASIAGVRYSIENPQTYVDNNISGFINLLEQSKQVGTKRIIYASSSSVYGLNKSVPFSEDDVIETCNSPYACSKYAMEVFAKTYEQLYDIDTIGLRFFTVYGPHGRPDMAPYKFLYNIKNGIPIKKFGDGLTTRDYTYIDDIVNGIITASFSDKINHYIYNIGNSNPVSLNKFIETCENVCNKKAQIEEHPMPLGDVPHTYANIEKAKEDFQYEPKTSLEEGLKKTYEWMVKEGL